MIFFCKLLNFYLAQCATFICIKQGGEQSLLMDVLYEHGNIPLFTT